MARYMLRRILQAIPTLIGISLLSFLILSPSPSDPILMRTFGDTKMTEADRDQIRRQYGLDQPWLLQYVNWMTGFTFRRGDEAETLTRFDTQCTFWSNLNLTVCNTGGGVLRGDLGDSWDTREPVWDRLVDRMPATLELGITSLVLSLLIGVPLGVLAAVYRGSWFDNTVRFFTVIFTSIPIFWTALLLILIFSVILGWLPSGGRQTVTINQQFDLMDRIRHLILPALVLSFGGIAGFSRIMRTETLEVLSTDYIRTARAKGLGNNSVWFVHALRNSLIPLMTILGPAIVGVLGGAVVTETIFSWPGMGRLTVNAAFSQDYPLVLGAGMFFAMLTIVGNLMSDVFYGWVDPRVRLE